MSIEEIYMDNISTGDVKIIQGGETNIIEYFGRLSQYNWENYYRESLIEIYG